MHCKTKEDRGLLMHAKEPTKKKKTIEGLDSVALGGEWTEDEEQRCTKGL